MLPTGLLMMALVISGRAGIGAIAFETAQGTPSATGELTAGATPTYPAVLVSGAFAATTMLSLEPSPTGSIDAQAVCMSLGPVGAALPDTVIDAGQVKLQLARGLHQLRVTLSTGARREWLTIDDMIAGREGSRRVIASYGLDPFAALPELRRALRDAPRVLGEDPSFLQWLSPTSFAYVTRGDTFIVRQEAGSLFQITLRPRVR